MKTVVISTVLSLFIGTGLYAQKSNCERWSIGAYFTLTQPIEEMQFNGFRTNYGLTLNALYNLSPELNGVNFHVGARFTGGLTRGQRDRITLIDPAGASARSSIYNTLVDAMLMGRLILTPEKKFQFYLDIYGGGRLTGSNQDIRLNRVISNYERRTSDRLTQSGNWSWGTGAGVLIRFRPNGYINIGVDHIRSQENSFVDLDSYSEQNDIIEYDIVNSISNSYGIHVGFHVILDCNGYDSYEREERRLPRRRLRANKRRPKVKQSGVKLSKTSHPQKPGEV